MKADKNYFCFKNKKFINSSECNPNCDEIIRCSCIAICMRCERMNHCELDKLNNDNVFQRVACSTRLNYGED